LDVIGPMSQGALLMTTPPTAPRRSSKGCLIAFFVVLGLFVVLGAGATVAVLWFFSSSGGPVGECFPVDTEGKIVTSEGTVSCSHPNALWRITKVVDGRFTSVAEACGADADGVSYIDAEDKSYCLEYYNY
jgi:hypothetical protein